MSILELEEVNIAEHIPMELVQDFSLSVEACWSRAFASFCCLTRVPKRELTQKLKFDNRPREKDLIIVHS